MVKENKTEMLRVRVTKSERQWMRNNNISPTTALRAQLYKLGMPNIKELIENGKK